MPVRRSFQEEGAWIRPHCDQPEQSWSDREFTYNTFLSAHRISPSPHQYLSLPTTFFSAGVQEADVPITRTDLSALDEKIEDVRRALKRHELIARQRAAFLMEVAGLPEVTPAEIDKLADEAYGMLSRGEISDPIAYAEKRGIDVRVSGLVFRRLLQQDRIEEA